MNSYLIDNEAMFKQLFPKMTSFSIRYEIISDSCVHTIQSDRRLLQENLLDSLESDIM